MPGKAAELLDMLGVDTSKRSFDYAVYGIDSSYGVPKVSPGKGAFDALFPPLPLED